MCLREETKAETMKEEANKRNLYMICVQKGVVAADILVNFRRRDTKRLTRSGSDEEKTPGVVIIEKKGIYPPAQFQRCHQ